MTAFVLTIAQQKGGAGKTTLAAQLAVTWAGQGKRVALLDIDPQESLSAWFWLRRELLEGEDDNLILETASAMRASMLVSRLRSDHDIIIIDSPPHTRTASQIGISRADMVLVPVQLSPMDLWATRPTIEMAARERTAALVVLNRVPPRGRAAAAVREAIEERKLPLARTALGNRAAFASSLMEGKGVTESQPSSLAAKEIAALAAEINRKMRHSQ